MNRKQFQSWLEQWPEDTEIHVGIQKEAPNYQSYGRIRFEEFKGEEYEDYDYTGFNGNKFATEQDWYYNKRILELGGRD